MNEKFISDKSKKSHIDNVEKVTHLTIDTNFITKLYNVDVGVTFYGYYIGLHRNQNKRLINYLSLRNLKNINNLKISMKNKDDNIVDIDLSPEKLIKIREVLQEGYDCKNNFDCSSFVHFIEKVSYQFAMFSGEKWNFEALNEEIKLNPGDAILISKSPDKRNVLEMVHLAIFLAGDLYLSQFGPGGRLIVTTLEEMKKGFDGNYVFKITPINELKNK